MEEFLPMTLLPFYLELDLLLLVYLRKHESQASYSSVYEATENWCQLNP